LEQQHQHPYRQLVHPHPQQHSPDQQDAAAWQAAYTRLQQAHVQWENELRMLGQLPRWRQWQMQQQGQYGWWLSGPVRNVADPYVPSRVADERGLGNPWALTDVHPRLQLLSPAQAREYYEYPYLLRPTGQSLPSTQEALPASPTSASSTGQQSDPDPDQVTIHLDGADFGGYAPLGSLHDFAPGDSWELVNVHVTFRRKGSQRV
jgi:hypothetical protein